MYFREYLILLVLNLGMFNAINAQSGKILGTITDLSYPLPGASVTIVGSAKGVSTNFDGNFVLKDVSFGEVEIRISYIGFEDKLLKVNLKRGEVKNLKTIILRPSPQSLNVVVIKGVTKRNSEARALSIQKKSMAILNVIAADGIGKLPDRNAAETVQRIQGVSIERDQGEGRFVSVRGLPPFWSSTTINGDRIPAAEEESTSRATAFDFFPSELISYVQVAKAYTPDMEADGIGGGVNFITQTAPSKKILSVNVGGGYSCKAEKPTYDISGVFGNKSKDGKIGYVINASHWGRNWGTDSFESRRRGGVGLSVMELRDYVGIRKTTGINGAFEYNPTDFSKIFIRGIYGELSDTEIQYKHRVRFDEFRGLTNTINVELQNIQNELITKNVGVNLGGKHVFSNGELDWALASYRNEFKYGNIPSLNDKSYFLVKFKQEGVKVNSNYLDVREDEMNSYRAYWKADGGILDYNDASTLFSFFVDPNFKIDSSQMKFTDLELYKVSVMERDNIVASVNFHSNVNDSLILKFGGKFRDKDRRASFEDLFYGWGDSNNAPYLSDFSQYLQEQPGRVDYLNEIESNIQTSFGQVLSVDGMSHFWKANKSNLFVLSEDSEGLKFNNGLGRNFDVDETHMSVYGMGTYKISEKITILGGVRATKTNTKVKGYAVADDKLNEVKGVKKYLAVLPMLHVKYEPNENINIRFATTRTFSRPNFGDISPSGTYISLDNKYKGGNPDLDPTYSLNFDLLGEYYFENVGIVNIGFFYKSIADPVFNDAYQGEYNGDSGVEFNVPKNAGEVWIEGIELGVNKRFDFLPEIFKYFGVQLNMTFMDSEMTKPSGRKVSAPYQAKHLLNAQLFFENEKFNARVAFNHKGKYPIEFGERDLDDLYYGKYSTLDLSASYKINKNLVVYSDLNNILNEPLIYHYGENLERPKQVEYYGVRGHFGVKFTL